MKHLVSLLLTAITAAVWLMFIYVVYLAAFDTNGLQVRESSSWGANGQPQTKFRAGDTIIAHRIICVNKVVPGEFSIEIHDSNGTVFVLNRGRTGQVGEGCQQRNVPHRLPESLRPGEYTLRAFATYETNPLRSERYELPPIPFEVIE